MSTQHSSPMDSDDTFHTGRHNKARRCSDLSSKTERERENRHFQQKDATQTAAVQSMCTRPLDTEVHLLTDQPAAPLTPVELAFVRECACFFPSILMTVRRTKRLIVNWEQKGWRQAAVCRIFLYLCASSASSYWAPCTPDDLTLTFGVCTLFIERSTHTQAQKSKHSSACGQRLEHRKGGMKSITFCAAELQAAPG